MPVAKKTMSSLASTHMPHHHLRRDLTAAILASTVIINVLLQTTLWIVLLTCSPLRFPSLSLAICPIETFFFFLSQMGNADSVSGVNVYTTSPNSRPHSPGSPAHSTYLFTPQMGNENSKEDNPSGVDAAYTTSSSAIPDDSMHSGQRSPSPALSVPQVSVSLPLSLL
uniref:Uncharacterized protein n=1 Tax=Brassica oleracea TaxID=3712 RepID=A0A3P6ANV0_BRAOL|nr:unnamed protein product [Brassica oleracea]